MFIGADGDPAFETDSQGPSKVVVLSKDEGRYEDGKWLRGRRLNGDELFIPGLPGPKISMLKVKLLRIE